MLRYLADETRWGRAWLSLLLYYIFEALLSDPVYGGNPDGIGWQWLEHQPGKNLLLAATAGGSVPYTWTIYANAFRVADKILAELAT